MSDRPREACGVVAIASAGAEPARLAFFGLYALQHRGQESAGICTADGESLRNLTGMGLVSQVFHERDLAKLGGHLAIGHTRYSTTGSQPRRERAAVVVGRRSDLGSLALAHNGNLVNVDEMREEVERLGVAPAHVDRLRADRPPDRAARRATTGSAACGTHWVDSAARSAWSC